MKTRCAVVVVAAGLLTSCAAAFPRGQQPDGLRPVGYPQSPSISPDGKTIVFTYAGDLWSADSGGGISRRISSHPADEGRSAFSPDGKTLVFESDRDGARTIYAMPVLATAPEATFGDVRRVTLGDRAQTLCGVSADGDSVYLSSNHEPAIFRGTKMYSSPLEGQGPLVRITDAYGAAASEAPGGTGIVFTRNRYDQSRPQYVGPAAADLFLLDPKAQSFTQLTTNAANDADGYQLADGSIAFVSARGGQNNIWKIPAGKDESAAVQLTAFKPAAGETTIAHGVRDFCVAPGGSTGVFVVWNQLYTIDLAAGGKPVALDVRLGGDFSQVDYQRLNLSKQVGDAALSPDGKTIAVVARGEIFVRSTEKDRPTRRVTDSPARETDIAWSPDGKTLYFASDESGVYGLYAATVELTRKDLEPQPEKKAEPGAADAKPEAADAEAKAQDKPDTVTKKEPKPVDQGKRWSDSITFSTQPVLVEAESLRGPTPSPDGASLLFVRSRGDLVLLDLKTNAQRVILEGWDSPAVLWCPDSKHIIFARNDEFFNSDIWLLNTEPGSTPVNITRHPDDDSSPRLSADGKVLYFLSDRDASTNGDFAAYAVNLDRSLDGLSSYQLAEYFKNAAEAAKKRKPLGAAAEEKGKSGKAENGKEGDDDAAKGEKPEGQAGEDEAKPDAKTDAKKEEPKAPEPLKFDLDDAYLRVRRIATAAGGVGDLQCTPGGERVLYSTSADGAASLVSVDYLGKERKTVTSGSVSRVSTNLGGDKVVYVSGGEAAIGKPTGGDSEKLGIEAQVVIDIEKQQKQKFLEAARLLGDGFYHPTLKGLDWAGLTRRYLSLAMATRTDSEFNAVVNCLFGELNGSHLGIRGGRDSAGDQLPLGYLGIDAAPTPDGWRVVRVLAQGPAARSSSPLAEGEVILSINGKPTAEKGMVHADLSVQLAGTSGRETLLKVRNVEGVERLMLITPVSSAADSGLRYDAEVARRAAMVDKLSGGKLGYLHIRGMDIGSVRDFERDLYAAAHGRSGLIIDVRDNGGGWTTDILLASLTAPRHAYTVPRGADEATMPRDAYPRDRRLIYAYNRPISVLINQNSYSNAEIFPHSIKTIGRGKLVGEQTFGAVISTGAATLIDGTTVRMPFRGWYLLDGTDMENHGAVPDIAVKMTPEAEVKAADPQIEAAVSELLERVAREPFWDWKK